MLALGMSKDLKEGVLFMCVKDPVLYPNVVRREMPRMKFSSFLCMVCTATADWVCKPA
jgi:hypothetical protein